MRRMASIWGALALTMFLAPEVQAACGKFVVVKGDIKVEFAKTKKTEPSRIGTEVCGGDTILAGKDSRAKIQMVDTNELNISPDSKIIIEAYDYKPEEGKKKVLLNVLYGKVRSTVNQKYDGQTSTFQVKTKSAVAGVRGTDFLTGYNPSTNKAEVVTFAGKVEVGQVGANGAIKNSVFVGAGQKTEASAGQKPATPTAVPASEMKQLNQETKADTAQGGSTGSQASGGGESKKENGDKKEDGKSGSDDKASGDKQESGGEKQTNGDKQEGGEKQASGDKPSGNEKQSGDSKSADNKQAAGGTDSGGSKDSGSKGDSGSGSSSTAGTGSATGGGGSSDSAKGPASGPTAGGGGGSAMPRAPASLPPSGGSMIDRVDVGGGAAANLPVMNQPMLPPSLGNIAPALPPTQPVCDFCNQTIQNGPSRVKINVNIQ